MSDNSTPQPTTEEERQELLERMWLAQARAAVAILENTPPAEMQAATLNTIRQFLGDNGMTIQTFKRFTNSARLGDLLKGYDGPEEPFPLPDYPED